MTDYLSHINSPADLKRLSVTQLPDLCSEIRAFLVDTLSKHPGHLASSLGTVELTVALHYVFDAPHDQLVWDVGHQAYTHKLLTGRREQFHTLRQQDGIAPFPTPQESPYDAFIAGHASNSISAALGIDVARRLKGDQDAHTIAIIGDGALTGGLAFEGLNNVSMTPNDMLIVVNDNHMAIDQLHGGMTQYLINLTTGHHYNKFRYWLYTFARKLHLIDENKKQRLLRFANSLRANNLFSGLAMRYFGPTDGHNVQQLVRILNEIKDYTGPKVLHLVTTKGKGYFPAERDPQTWHAPGRFDPATSERVVRDVCTWQQVFAETVYARMCVDQRVVVITPAMPAGSGLERIKHDFPGRFFDVGIAEAHAVTFAAGLAKNGRIPVCCIYSTFLQRAYDSLVHDTALLKLPVLLAVDRAGLVGPDGITHNGLLDINFLRTIPNVCLYAPSTSERLRTLLCRTFDTLTGPTAIRYPRGEIEHLSPRNTSRNHTEAYISVGHVYEYVESLLAGTDIPNYGLERIQPLDYDTLTDIVAQHYQTVTIVDESSYEGSIAQVVELYLRPYVPQIHVRAVQGFALHGTIAQQRVRFLTEGTP